MNKSTPITSRIQKRSIGGIVQPALEDMGSVAKMLKNSAGGRPGKGSPAKVDKKNNYNSQGRSERNQNVRNAIKSFFTPDGRRDPRLSSSKSQASKFLTMGVNDQNPGLKNYTGEGATVEKIKNTSTSTSAPKTKFAGRTPYTVENGKGKIHGPKDSYAKAYEKRDMKVYGNMNQAEFTKEAKRQTKSFETTGKFDAKRKKVTATTTLKPNGVEKKSVSIGSKLPSKMPTKELVSKPAKTAKQKRKSTSIDKKLSKAKVARESGNIKKADRKEKRAENKQERMAKRSRTRSENTAIKGNKAVDEGRDRKADRLLKRAARQENREIKKEERKAKRNK
tara:strand:- start:59 stop:1066 length:1008 start_codon:yes stop_codon:yes gene_type:complete